MSHHRRIATAITLAVASALALLAGCGGDDTSTADPTSFAVVISSEAARAAEDADVDLEELVSRSATTALAVLPHRGQVQIQVQLDATAVIPEIGVGGITGPSGDVRISIEDRPPGALRKALETWVPATVAHELHHSSRVRVGPGYGDTLGEALVTEGLADRFMEEVFPATPPAPWDNALSKEREAALWRRARPDLEIPGGYDHAGWFFGASDLPRWTGYTLGYRIAGAYLGGKRKPSRSVKVRADKIIAAYHFANPS